MGFIRFLTAIKRVILNLFLFKYLWTFGRKQSSDIEMELLKAVEFESTDKISKILNSYDSIPENQVRSYYELLKKALEVGRVDVAKLLLDKGCMVNESIESATASDTPLHYAVKLNNEELVKELLEKGASITRVNANRDTALHLAFLDNKQPIIKLLVNSIEVTSADDNKKNRHGLTHLHIVSTRKNSAKIIEDYVNINKDDIVQPVNAGAPRWKGYTALHFAAKFGSSESMKSLLMSFNVDDLIRVKESKGKTTLDLVEKQLNNFQEMSYLLKNGENNKPKLDTELPLHCAVKLGQKICVKLLLRDNADPELIDERTSSTPLHLALYRDNPWEKNSIVEMLYESLKEKSIKNGQPLANKQDDNGASYLHIAVTRNDKETVREFLKDQPEDVNSEIRLNSQGFSNFAPLHFATKYRHREMVELLIDRGARVDQLCADGTALHIACELGEHVIIELLLKNQADVNVVRASDSKTPLHLLVCHFANNCHLSDAKENNDVILKYIEQLIKVGANVNAKDEFQRTALFQRPRGLFVHGFVDCMKILLDGGADVNLGRFDTRCDSSAELSVDNLEVLYEHLMKLITLNLKVNQENRDMYQTIGKILAGNSGIKTNELATQREKISGEVNKMKNTNFGVDQLTLYKFLHLEPRRAAIYTEINDGLIKFKDKLEEAYPVYANLIKLHCRRAVMFERSSRCGCMNII